MRIYVKFLILIISRFVREPFFVCAYVCVRACDCVYACERIAAFVACKPDTAANHWQSSCVSRSYVHYAYVILYSITMASRCANMSLINRRVFIQRYVYTGTRVLAYLFDRLQGVSDLGVPHRMHYVRNLRVCRVHPKHNSKPDKQDIVRIHVRRRKTKSPGSASDNHGRFASSRPNVVFACCARFGSRPGPKTYVRAGCRGRPEAIVMHRSRAYIITIRSAWTRLTLLVCGNYENENKPFTSNPRENRRTIIEMCEPNTEWSRIPFIPIDHNRLAEVDPRARAFAALH